MGGTELDRWRGRGRHACGVDRLGMQDLVGRLDR
jgi:hypothetical protein